MRVMMMIKGDREPGHVPSEDLLAEMGKYNEELSKAGVLRELGALHWSAEGVRVKFLRGKRTVIEGPFGDPKEIVAGYFESARGLWRKFLLEAGFRGFGFTPEQWRRVFRTAIVQPLVLVHRGSAPLRIASPGPSVPR
jgi:hypothetical protein